MPSPEKENQHYERGDALESRCSDNEERYIQYEIHTCRVPQY